MASVNVAAVDGMSDGEWQVLYEICLVWFTGYGLDFFKEEFGKSDECVLLRVQENGPPVGFASLKGEILSLAGREVGIFYTGHCFAQKEYWGNSALVRGLWARMGTRMRERPDLDWYWTYSAIGYRSFRYMPLLFRRFLPAVKDASDPFERRLRDRIGEEMFGDLYEPGTGLVDWQWEGYSLSELAADISEAKQSKETIAALERLNPRWAEGVEILCQGKLSTDNLTKLSARWLCAEL